MVKIPYVIAADWNATPEQLQEEDWGEWLGFIRGSIVAPAVPMTCTAGKGRVLDYVVCSPVLRTLISIELDFETPWTPHIGLQIEVREGAGADIISFPTPQL